jgi:cellulose synthase/poly-beta-1,6-N-acetylglucosamine synthase-like glycosyltransferase
MTGIFWLLLALLIYVYFGYPLLTATAAAVLDREWRKVEMHPRISIIIAVYNEEKAIRERLENLLATSYPPDHLEIIVASDGSNDNTDAIVSDYESRGVRLLRCERRGKLYALNQAVRLSTAEIVCFTDANTHFEAASIGMLVRSFADSDVGAVSGRVIYSSPPEADSVGQGEQLYWSYESQLKSWESRTGNVVSATGKIYAIRRALYCEPSTFTGTDDFLISTSVIQQGYRLVYDGDARAYQEPASSAEGEFGRKVRMVKRGLSSLVARRYLLNGYRYGYYSLSLFSHKLLRRLVPIFLIGLFITSLLLASSHSVYLFAVWMQAAFLALAMSGWLLRRRATGKFRVLYIPYFFCLSNAAILVALAGFISGERVAAWNTQR